MSAFAAQCRAPGCRREARRNRMCWPHRYRWVRYGAYEGGEWSTADEFDIALAVECRRMPDGVTRLERKRIGLQLSERGLSLAEVARITRVTPRTVCRWRSARRRARDGS